MKKEELIKTHFSLKNFDNVIVKEKGLSQNAKCVHIDFNTFNITEDNTQETDGYKYHIMTICSIRVFTTANGDYSQNDYTTEFDCMVKFENDENGDICGVKSIMVKNNTIYITKI